jgi:AcrR family transcriptional regulator
VFAADGGPDTGRMVDSRAYTERVTESAARPIRAAALELFAAHGYRATTMADIGAALGIRGPSLYKHVQSKQDLLAEIMVDTITTLIANQRSARRAGGDIVVQVRRMVEAHVRFHTTHREQAFVGNREIGNLEDPHRDKVLRLRRSYEQGLRQAIAEGIRCAAFTVEHPRLASYAVLDMGIGVATWFSADGPYSADQIAYTYADFAIAMFQRGATAAPE